VSDLSLQIPAISSGPFIATPTGLVVENGKGPVDYELWHAYGQGLRRVESAIQWVIGDWLNYGERAYGEEYSQALALWPEREYGTLRDYKWVAARFELSERSDNLSWVHHRIVAALEPPERDRLLGEAVENDWHTRELRQAVRDHQNGIRRDAAALAGVTAYNVIYADPPWAYDNQNESWGPASLHYSGMALAELVKLPKEINLTVAADAVLFLWSTNPFLNEALELMEAWDFEYKTNLVWAKTEHRQRGTGFYVRGRHELLLLGTRGSFTPLEQHISPPIGSVIMAPLREHSRKPDEVYDLIEKLYPGCRYMELFARGQRNGWDAWGNQAG